MSAKRMRIHAAAADIEHTGRISSTISLSDLPVEPLTLVASYLAPPSRALFDVALNNNFEAKPSADTNDSGSSSVNRIAGGDDWDVLDFGHIEPDLAAKLSDDDIRGVLLSIDAAHNLKKLRLTNCINITGVGLEPLRGSMIIEQIDLSLVDYHESPELEPEPRLSCDEVLPILISIVSIGYGQYFALKHLHFPWCWREENYTESEAASDFLDFLYRYNAVLQDNGTISCKNCNRHLPPRVRRGRAGWMIMSHRTSSAFGSQRFTCCKCMSHYCEYCPGPDGYDEEDEDEYDRDDCVRLMGTLPCRKCKMIYCLDCQEMEKCDICSEQYCADYCGEFQECYHCHDVICYSCVSKESNLCIICYKYRGRSFKDIVTELGPATSDEDIITHRTRMKMMMLDRFLSSEEDRNMENMFF